MMDGMGTEGRQRVIGQKFSSGGAILSGHVSRPQAPRNRNENRAGGSIATPRVDGPASSRLLPINGFIGSNGTFQLREKHLSVTRRGAATFQIWRWRRFCIAWTARK